MSDIALLECHGVSKRFGAVHAVADLSFRVQSGEVLGITGPNGAGKTTLFEVISGFTHADQGQILFGGQDISRHTPQDICRAGVCRFFQQNTAFDSMSVFDNVAVAATFGRQRGQKLALRGKAARKEVDAAVTQALAMVNLSARRHVIAGTLSVFERKCLMLATSIVTQPRLLLLDEPVGGLNPEEMDAMAELVLNLNRQGMTLVLIEHVMRFMFKLAPRVMVMHHGTKVFDGPAQSMVSDPTVQKLYLGERGAQKSQQFLQEAKASS